MNEKENHKQISQMIKFTDQNGDRHIAHEAIFK